jgi:hypothetical protein
LPKAASAKAAWQYANALIEVTTDPYRALFECSKFVGSRPFQCYAFTMLNPGDARRRWFGSFFIILAAGLLLWGLTFLGEYLVNHPTFFVIYWSSCLLLTLGAFCIAIYDLRVMRRRLRKEHKSAFEKAFSDIKESEKK